MRDDGAARNAADVGSDRGDVIGHHRLEPRDQLRVVPVHGQQIGELAGKLVKENDLPSPALVYGLRFDAVPEGGARPGCHGAHIDYAGARLDDVVGYVAADVGYPHVVPEHAVDQGGIEDAGR